MRYVFNTLAVLSLAACGIPGGQSTADDPTPPAGLDSTFMQAPGMPHSAMGSDALMVRMRQHMVMMQGQHADTGQAALAMHRMGAQMLAQMEKDRENAKLPADPRWTALLDSVRKDMAAMPGLRGGMMHGRGRGMMSESMTAHRDRMMRLMDMHESRLPQHQTPSR